MSGVEVVIELVAVTHSELLPSFDRVNQSKSRKLCWGGAQGLGWIPAGAAAIRVCEPVVGSGPASADDVVPKRAQITRPKTTRSNVTAKISLFSTLILVGFFGKWQQISIHSRYLRRALLLSHSGSQSSRMSPAALTTNRRLRQKFKYFLRWGRGNEFSLGLD